MDYIANVYFKVLNEKGRVFIQRDKRFLNDFIRECRERNIPVRNYKRKGYYEIIKG